MFCVMWAEGGTNDEREASTKAFPAITHSEMELKTELNGRVIRVYWARALNKAWFTGKISEHDPLSTRLSTLMGSPRT